MPAVVAVAPPVVLLRYITLQDGGMVLSSPIASNVTLTYVVRGHHNTTTALQLVQGEIPLGCVLVTLVSRRGRQMRGRRRTTGLGRSPRSKSLGYNRHLSLLCSRRFDEPRLEGRARGGSGQPLHTACAGYVRDRSFRTCPRGVRGRPTPVGRPPAASGGRSPPCRHRACLTTSRHCPSDPESLPTSHAVSAHEGSRHRADP